MGTWGSKEEIVVAQTAAGAGSGGSSVSITEMTTGGILIIAVAALAYYLYTKCRKRFYKKVMRHVDSRQAQAAPVPTVSMRCSHHASGAQGAPIV